MYTDKFSAELHFCHNIPSQPGQGNEDTSSAPEEDPIHIVQLMSYSDFASMVRSPLYCTYGLLDTPQRRVSYYCL